MRKQAGSDQGGPLYFLRFAALNSVQNLSKIGQTKTAFHKPNNSKKPYFTRHFKQFRTVKNWKIFNLFLIFINARKQAGSLENKGTSGRKRRQEKGVCPKFVQNGNERAIIAGREPAQSGPLFFVRSCRTRPGDPCRNLPGRPHSVKAPRNQQDAAGRRRDPEREEGKRRAARIAARSGWDRAGRRTRASPPPLARGAG